MSSLLFSGVYPLEEGKPANTIANDANIIHVPRTANKIPLPQYNADKRCQRVHVFITPEVYR